MPVDTLIRYLALVCLAAMLLAPAAAVASTQAADPTERADVSAVPQPYPFTDPFKATVFGTPPKLALSFEAPVAPDTSAIAIDDRRIPDIFWYDSKMFYSTAMQDGEAPLIFIVAGTGSEHDSAKMIFLTNLFHEAGFHVVALSSPTHMNFIVSASQHVAPGFVPYDVADLYRVMDWIKQDLTQKHDISGYYLTGYSLGGMHTAFLMHMDEQRGRIGFDRGLMINPAVSLYDSAMRFDRWLSPENLGDTTPRQVMQNFLNAFSQVFANENLVDLDDDFLYELSRHTSFPDMELKALVGTAFRVFSSSMIFTADVCLDAGYVVPKGAQLDTGNLLMPYIHEVSRITFSQYIDEFLLPYLQHLDPAATKDGLIRACSLESIRPWLESTDKLLVLGNEDDVILTDENLRFLKEVFDDRLVLFPHGGHCGNIKYAPFARRAQEMLAP